MLEGCVKEQKREIEKFKNNQMTNNQALFDTICKVVTSGQNNDNKVIQPNVPSSKP